MSRGEFWARMRRSVYFVDFPTIPIEWLLQWTDESARKYAKAARLELRLKAARRELRRRHVNYEVQS